MGLIMKKILDRFEDCDMFSLAGGFLKYTFPKSWEELRFTPVVYIKGIGKYKVEINNIDEIGNILKWCFVVYNHFRKVG